MLLGLGLWLHWAPFVLFVLTVPAVAMSVFLGYSLIVNKRECRICWAGHTANAVLFLLLGLRAL